MNSYEALRLENIKENQRLLAKLNLESLRRNAFLQPGIDERRPAKRRKTELQTPSRASARIASNPKPSYSEEPTAKYDIVNSKERGKKSTTSHNEKSSQESNPREPDYDRKSIDSIRLGWTNWSAVAPQPTRGEHGAFHFESHPLFTPNKSPEEIIREGCFGGSYFRSLRSQKLGIIIEDDYKELPSPWIKGLNISKYLTSPRYDPDINKYKVACGQSIEEWEAAGWIDHNHDVRGWFQWYIRFYQGRRCEDDDRQVSRWRKCVGDTGRWRRILLKKYVALGVREVFDDGAEEDAPSISPVIHQTCHYWAFEVKQDVLDEFWRTGK